jgi:tetratricopeptide (TPR) repeat protein
MDTRLLRALCIGLIAGTVSAGGAHAAVTVIGSGSAQLCYRAADQGGSPREGIAYCNDALGGALTPEDRAATYVNRGVLELAMLRINAAQDDFNAGLAINANLGEAYVDRGATLIAQKRFAEAIVDINKGLALNAKEPHIAYYDRAVADEALGNLKAAYDDYRQALIAQPDFKLASEELKRFKIVEKPPGT